MLITKVPELWFDVEKKNYTTLFDLGRMFKRLWFDVEKKNYTTSYEFILLGFELWFDVEKKNYTTKQTTTVIAIIRKICC